MIKIIKSSLTVLIIAITITGCSKLGNVEDGIIEDASEITEDNMVGVLDTDGEDDDISGVEEDDAGGDDNSELRKYESVTRDELKDKLLGKDKDVVVPSKDNIKKDKDTVVPSKDKLNKDLDKGNNTNKGNKETQSSNNTTTSNKTTNNKTTTNNVAKDTPTKKPNNNGKYATVDVEGNRLDVTVKVNSIKRGASAVKILQEMDDGGASFGSIENDGFDISIVNITVTLPKNMGNYREDVIPEIRVRDTKGKLINGEAIHVYVDELGKYNNTGLKKKYDIIFEIPERVKEYTIVFGEYEKDNYIYKVK